MKKRTRAGSSSLFLIELIFAILFFAVASSVCVQIFVKAHTMSSRAEVLNHAALEVSSAAELVCSSDSAEEASALVAEHYPDVSAVITCEDRMITAHLTYADGEGHEVYDLTVEHFVLEGGAHE